MGFGSSLVEAIPDPTYLDLGMETIQGAPLWLHKLTAPGNLIILNDLPRLHNDWDKRLLTPESQPPSPTV